MIKIKYMTKKNQMIIVGLIAVALLVGLAVAMLPKKDQPATTTPAEDTTYVEFSSVENNITFKYHKDWQVTGGYGAVRISPKETDGQVKYLNISFFPDQKKLTELGFGTDKADKVTIGGKEMSYVEKSLEWKVPEGMEPITTKTDYYLYEGPGRNLFFELEPGYGNQLPEELKKVFETLQLTSKK
jgi:hypothetical protein